MTIAFFVIIGVISTMSILVSRPCSTVKNFLHRYYKHGTVKNLLRTGRHEALTKRDKQTILRSVRKSWEYTREQIGRIYAPHVSLHTIDRMLREHNIKKWLAKKRPKLTADHTKARLQWALAHKDWTAEDFQGVIYSDECNVEQEPAGHQRWVFRTPQKKWEKSCILSKNRCRVTLMVRDCFWGSQRGPLVPLMPANGSTYHSLLVSTEICCAVDSFLSSRAFEHPSAVIIYFNKTMLAYTLQSLCSTSLKDMAPLASPIHVTLLT